MVKFFSAVFLRLPSKLQRRLFPDRLMLQGSSNESAVQAVGIWSELSSNTESPPREHLYGFFFDGMKSSQEHPEPARCLASATRLLTFEAILGEARGRLRMPDLKEYTG